MNFGEIKEEMKIKSGIRQGCTGSTIFFKIVTYLIITKLENMKGGYINDNINIKTLFFADDALKMVNSIEETREIIKATIEISNYFGLQINKRKSNIYI